MSMLLNPYRFGSTADPGLTLLQSATLWLDASDMASGAEWIRNKGTGGRALDARVGSVGSAQIIDGALKLPGLASSNHASAPDLAAYDVAGSGEWILRVSAIDWTPSATQTMFSRFHSGSQLQPFVYLNTGGTLGIDWIDGGAAYRGNTSTAAAPFTDGQTGWIRVTYDGANVKFFTAADQTSVPSSWTQLGADVARSQNPAAGTAPIFLGCLASGSQSFNGSIFHARLIVGGTVVFDANFTAQSTLATSFTESSSNAATVTINSATGVDTNDPLLLPHTGTNYLYLPGSASNRATIPDYATSRPTGDLELVARIAPSDWTPATNRRIINSGGDATATMNYCFSLHPDGKLLLERYVNGGGAGTRFAYSTVATGFTDGDTKWVKVTFDTDNGSGGSDFKFYTAADEANEPTVWTQLGATVTVAGVTGAGNANTSGITIGTDFVNANFFWSGSFYRVIGRDGISGTTFVDANFSTNTGQSTFTESSSNAATVTINRATSGRKAVMVVRPTLLFGTDDYLEVADNALLNMGTGNFSVVTVIRRWGTQDASSNRIVSKLSVGTGWTLANTATSPNVQMYIVDGAGGASASTAGTLGAAQLVSGIVGGGNVSIGIGSTLTSAADTEGSVSNASAMRVGADPTGTPLYCEMEVMHVAVYQGTALTSTELGQIATYLGV